MTDHAKKSWKELELHGAAAISRLCGEYVVTDVRRVPGTKYRIKVFERANDFIGLPDIRFRNPDGSVDGTCGLGATELEALQDAITQVAKVLASRAQWSERDIEWADPRDF